MEEATQCQLQVAASRGRDPQGEGSSNPGNKNASILSFLTGGEEGVRPGEGEARGRLGKQKGTREARRRGVGVQFRQGGDRGIGGGI